LLRVESGGSIAIIWMIGFGASATPTAQSPAAALGLGTRIGCHTFRATGITAYLDNGGTLENAQLMAAHESPRTTKLYDRTGDEITLDEVERIAI
jgi:integrase